MNMFARFDENPAMTLQVIKKTQNVTDGRTHGHTHARTDNVKTVHPTTNKVCGGIIMGSRQHKKTFWFGEQGNNPISFKSNKGLGFALDGGYKVWSYLHLEPIDIWYIVAYNYNTRYFKNSYPSNLLYNRAKIGTLYCFCSTG